ncbi:hypothetical protein [Microbacterium sp.]|uniref:hypothetical protein n=1 Tax=Microbacterium sp. TaxID=51671 RepID=UPI0025EC3002|nr:hypothetical protein [Microbacterium sp.]
MQLPGRVMIAARAYERVAATVIADELGVAARGARAVVRDADGAIAADLTCGIGLGEAPIAQRAARARTRTAERLAEITGARVADVRLRVSHVVDERGGAS